MKPVAYRCLVNDANGASVWHFQQDYPYEADAAAYAAIEPLYAAPPQPASGDYKLGWNEARPGLPAGWFDGWLLWNGELGAAAPPQGPSRVEPDAVRYRWLRDAAEYREFSTLHIGQVVLVRAVITDIYMAGTTTEPVERICVRSGGDAEVCYSRKNIILAETAAQPASEPARDGERLLREALYATPEQAAPLPQPIKSSYPEIPDNSPVSAAKPTAGSEPLREALLEARKYVHAASCEGESYVRSKQAARVLRQIDVALATAQEQRHD